MRSAAASMSASVATGMPASTPASWRFGVTTVASGRISLTSAARASGSSSGSPDLAIITGSSTIWSCPCALRRLATSAMIGAVESMPIFTASAPKSESTEWICVPMNSGGRLKTPWTPTEFCAVTAVITLIPKTRKAEKVLRSAWMPAPPPESEPAMVNALGTTIDPRSIRRTEGTLKRRPAQAYPRCTLTPTAEAVTVSSGMASLRIRTRRWTRQEYDRLIEIGVLQEDDPIELIEGRLVVAEPKQDPHARTVELGPDSAPEPDVSVVRGTPRDAPSGHPTTAALVVEIADSSLRLDRGPKARACARVGIADYWIVSLIDRTLEVDREPSGREVRGRARYTSVETLGADATLAPLAAPHARISVADLLP